MLLVMEGTNCEDEAFRSFSESGFDPKKVHVNELDHTALEDFDAVYLPGGFSAGDYVRAGSLFASRLMASKSAELARFIDEGKPVIGVCNGFQILAESGLIPDVSHHGKREVALASNISNRFECRLIYIRNVGRNRMLSEVAMDPTPVPVAHGEGRVVFSDKSIIEEMKQRGQILFAYSDPDGNTAGYPWNPNGSEENIAGMTNEEGNVIGLMPHPERLYYGYQLPYKLRSGKPTIGKQFFGAVHKYVMKVTA
jgi:phosphoribosylformylglycinamidine synthase